MEIQSDGVEVATIKTDRCCTCPLINIKRSVGESTVITAWCSHPSVAMNNSFRKEITLYYNTSHINPFPVNCPLGVVIIERVDV